MRSFDILLHFCLCLGWLSSCLPRGVCFINSLYTNKHTITGQFSLKKFPSYPLVKNQLFVTKCISKDIFYSNKSTDLYPRQVMRYKSEGETLDFNPTYSCDVYASRKELLKSEINPKSMPGTIGGDSQSPPSIPHAYIKKALSEVDDVKTKSSFLIPQGEAWKEGKFPKGAPRIISVDPFDILIQMRCEPGWFYRDILQEATDYNARLLPPEHYTKAFMIAYKQVKTQFPCFGARNGISSKDWWRYVSKLTYHHIDITEIELRKELDKWLFDDIFDVLYHDVFTTNEAWEIRPGALEALSFIKKWRDMEEDGPEKICILCNFDERMHEILKELDFSDSFDFILTSREIGTELSDESAFQVAMSKAGVKNPTHCMHVSSDFSNCVVGASKAGWHSVYLPKNGEQNIPTNTNSNVSFTTLRDLFSVLHIWNRNPSSRLIDTTQPVLENGIFGFHIKNWNKSSKVKRNDPYFLPQPSVLKRWDNTDRC